MSRLAIELPETVVYTIEFTIPAEFINSGDHLGADRVLSVAMMVQDRFTEYLGYSGGMYRIEGLGLIMADSAIVYKSESSLGDVLQVDVAVSGITDKAFELIYRLRNLTNSCDAALVKTSMLTFDYSKKVPASIPSRFRAKLMGHI